MKVKELIELLGHLNPDDNITIAIACEDEYDNSSRYQKYVCCEHFIIHECQYGETEIIGLDLDLWKNETYKNNFCKEYNYPKNKLLKLNKE